MHLMIIFLLNRFHSAEVLTACLRCELKFYPQQSIWYWCFQRIIHGINEVYVNERKRRRLSAIESLMRYSREHTEPCVIGSDFPRDNQRNCHSQWNHTCDCLKFNIPHRENGLKIIWDIYEWPTKKKCGGNNIGPGYKWNTYLYENILFICWINMTFSVFLSTQFIFFN